MPRNHPRYGTRVGRTLFMVDLGDVEKSHLSLQHDLDNLVRRRLGRVIGYGHLPGRARRGSGKSEWTVVIILLEMRLALDCRLEMLMDFDIEDVQTFKFQDDGTIPNNPTLPVLLYRNAFSGVGRDIRHVIYYHVKNSDWNFRKREGSLGKWFGQIPDYPQYHSNTHEFLVVVRSYGTVRIGGEEGVDLELSTGDALVLPSGTGHRQVEADESFELMAAYPGRDNFDVKTGEPDERPEVLEKIRSVGVPATDPICGEDGPLPRIWSAAR